MTALTDPQRHVLRQFPAHGPVWTLSMTDAELALLPGMAAAERYDRLAAWAQRLLDAPRDDDRGER